MSEMPEMKPIITQIMGQMRTEYEDGVMKAVQSYGFDVDKDRLLQALTDARAFYEEGYRAAMRQSEWISVEERLPEPYEVVLTARKFAGVSMEFRYAEGEWAADDRYSKKYRPVTHWMPLPRPPVVVAENATASEEG